MYCRLNDLVYERQIDTEMHAMHPDKIKDSKTEISRHALVVSHVTFFYEYLRL